jgi:hypothetical protein
VSAIMRNVQRTYDTMYSSPCIVRASNSSSRSRYGSSEMFQTDRSHDMNMELVRESKLLCEVHASILHGKLHLLLQIAKNFYIFSCTTR